MDWRWLAVASAVVPGVPLFLTMIPLPESPQWLTKTGKMDKAEKSITWVLTEHGVERTTETGKLYVYIFNLLWRYF